MRFLIMTDSINIAEGILKHNESNKEIYRGNMWLCI